MPGPGAKLATRACAAILIALLSLAPRVTRADETEAARIHFKAGEQYYVRGHYAQAISEFAEAYRLSKAPALLYNISQAHERAGDLVSARDYLQRYIDSGETEPGELSALREKLASLDRRIAARATEPAPGTPPPGTTPPGTEPDRASARPYRTWKWIAAGTGVGLLAVAGLFALDGQRQEQTLEDAVATPPLVYTEELDETYARGQRANQMALVFGLSGAALAATGAVLFVLDAGSGERARPAARARVAPVVGPGVLGAAAAWRF
jgi:tetratricopeptide (TPR) repeat protein